AVGIASDVTTVVEAAEGTMATGEPMLRGASAVKCISAMKLISAVKSTVGVVVVVYHGPAVGYVGVVVENYGAVVPVRVPIVPAPAKADEETNSKASAKRDSW